MKLRPNPFLEKRMMEQTLKAARQQPTSPLRAWFNLARDWTAFLVAFTSLVTALFALKNTFTGPQPFLAQLAGDAITIFRSDQFLVGSPPMAAIVLRDENGLQNDFPLILVQTTLANRAAPPNSIAVRSIESDMVFFQAGQTLFRSTYFWYRLTTSSSVLDNESKVDRISFSSAEQIAPFDLAGGSTWSKEILFIPRQTWAAASWGKLDNEVLRHCDQQPRCQGNLLLHVRLDNGVTLSQSCNFTVTDHLLAHLQGKERRYFTSPMCEDKV
jgi:hypothetical protein